MAYNGNTPGNIFGQGSKDSFNGDGSTTAFTMSKSVLLATDIDVFVGNVRQEPNVAYSVSGATLTFTGTPSSGTGNIYVVHKATSLGTLVPPTGRAENLSTMTATGDVTGLTLNATGDTSAGDNAAIGFTSTEGLILTGQGSTSDIAIKNDADSLVASVATGTTVMNFASTPTAGSVAVKVAGVETIWVPANSMYPNTTNGCALITQVELSNGPEIKVLDFDPSSDENAQFSVAFPKSWNEGTITFKAYFTVTGTNTGTVAWGLSGVAIADDDSINTAFGTNVVATAKAHSGTSNDLNVTAESGAVTIAGSPAAGEQVFFQIMRDVSADDQSGDARLLGVQLFFTTDAANDA